MNIFKREIFTLKPQFFGLDFSDGFLKIVQISESEGVDKISGFVSDKIPLGVVEGGEIRDVDKFSLLVKNALNKKSSGKIKTNKVFCSIPESKAFLRVVNIPNMKPQEATEAVKWEIEANIPMDIDEVYYGWQFIETAPVKKEGKRPVLTVSVAKKVVDSYFLALSGAGLDPWGFELESVATMRSLIKETSNSGEECAEKSFIIDLGHGRTSFIIGEANVPFFTSSIPFSSYEIVETIMKRLDISRKEAATLLKETGIGLDSKNKHVFKAIESLLENLAQEIEKTIRFYEDNIRKETSVDKLVLSGQGVMKGLAVYLAKKLKKDVQLGDPWVNVEIGKSLPPISKEESLNYSVALGLTLKGKYYEFR